MDPVTKQGSINGYLAGGEATQIARSASCADTENLVGIRSAALESPHSRTLSETGSLGDNIASQISPAKTDQPHLDEPEMSDELEEALRPIARKRNIRALTRNPEKDEAPIICRVDLIRGAMAQRGYHQVDLAEMLNLSVATVRKALEADPSTKLYVFCAIINLLGLEMADVFPVRKKLVVNGPTASPWVAGPHLQENAERLQRPSAVAPRKRVKI